MQNPNRNPPEDTVVSLESSDFLFGRWQGAATQTRETGHSSASGSSSSPSLLSPLLFLPLPSIRWSTLAASHIHKWIEAEWRSNKLNGCLSPVVRQWGGGWERWVITSRSAAVHRLVYADLSKQRLMESSSGCSKVVFLGLLSAMTSHEHQLDCSCSACTRTVNAK